MAGTKGNTNAEKWTADSAVKFIDAVHQYNLSNLGNYHLGLATIECGKCPDTWSYIATKFSDNEIVLRAIKRVETTLEARIINSTLSGDARSAAMAIFVLKNKYGYIDKSESTNTVTISPPLDPGKIKEISKAIGDDY